MLDDDVADIAMALTLAAVRRLPQAERYLREGPLAERPFPLTASLRGRTMGILGLGRIGSEIAKRAARLRARGRLPRPQAAGGRALSLLSDAERHGRGLRILMVAAPGGPATRHIINAEILTRSVRDGVLVNVARGSLVDEAALIEALREGTILAAGLDVYANEPNVPPGCSRSTTPCCCPMSVRRRCRPGGNGQLVVDNVLCGWRARAR